MLSIGLSLNSSIKFLERTLKFRVSGLFQDAVYEYAPAAEAVVTKTLAAEKTVGLKIAKTILPDERPDFNETFVHIRQELDGFYKERNPIFSNTIQPEHWSNQNDRVN